MIMENTVIYMLESNESVFLDYKILIWLFKQLNSHFRFYINLDISD